MNFDYTQVKHYKFYGFVKKVFGPVFKAVYKLEFKGLENVPADKNLRYIVAINHTCAFDPVFVSIPKNVPPLHFMAKVELFKNPIVGWVIKHLYGFPVRRGKGDNSAIEYGEKSVAVIAKATNAAVLPAAIYCDGPIKFGKKVTIRYGKLITVEELGLNKEETAPSDIKNAANLVMDNILSLWEAEKNERN